MANPLKSVQSISDDDSVIQFLQGLHKFMQKLSKEVDKGGKFPKSSSQFLASSQSELWPALHRCFEAYRSPQQIVPHFSSLVTLCLQRINYIKLEHIRNKGSNSIQSTSGSMGVKAINTSLDPLSIAKLIPAYTLTGVLKLVQDYEAVKADFCSSVLKDSVQEMVQYLTSTDHNCQELDLCACQARYYCGALIEKTVFETVVSKDMALVSKYLLSLHECYSTKNNLKWLYFLSVMYPIHRKEIIEQDIYPPLIRHFKLLIHAEEDLKSAHHNQILLAHTELITKVSSQNPSLFNAKLFTQMAVYEIEKLQKYSNPDERLTFSQYMTLLKLLEKIAAYNCISLTNRGSDYYDLLRRHGRFDCGDIKDKQANAIITQINTVLLTLFAKTTDEVEAARVIRIMGSELSNDKPSLAIKHCIIRDLTVVAYESPKNHLLKPYKDAVKTCTKEPALKQGASNLLSAITDLKAASASSTVQSSLSSNSYSTKYTTSSAESRLSTASTTSSKSCTIM